MPNVCLCVRFFLCVFSVENRIEYLLCLYIYVRKLFLVFFFFSFPQSIAPHTIPILICHIYGTIMSIYPLHYKKLWICYRHIMRVNIKFHHICHRDQIFWITDKSRLSRILLFPALRILWILRASSTNTPFLLSTFPSTSAHVYFLPCHYFLL